MSLAAPVSWWLAALLLAAAAAVGYWAYARTAVPLAPGRRVVLTALRATALLLLTVFLLRPVATTAVPERRGVLSVVLDNSRSMQISDADGAADRRIDRAVSFLRDELLPAVGERLEVRVATFDRAVPLDALGTVEPNAARTDLAAALRRAADLGDGRTADGIVVVSDGGDTGGGDLVKAVEGLPPVFAVDVGAAVPGADQEVTALSAASAAVAASLAVGSVVMFAFLEGDNTVAGLLRVALTWGLGFTSLVAMLAMLYLSTSTLEGEFTGRQIHLLAVKPVSRWKILVGKWIGLSLLSAALIVTLAFLAYLGVHWLRHRTPDEERLARPLAELTAEADREVLVSRQSLLPVTSGADAATSSTSNVLAPGQELTLRFEGIPEVGDSQLSIRFQVLRSPRQRAGVLAAP